MKNNNKFRLDVWGAITLGTIALYALFLLYPMAYLIRQSVLDPDTGGFTLHPVQAGGADDVVRQAVVGASEFVVPGLTVAVFVEPGR